MYNRESNARLLRSISDKFWDHIGTDAQANPAANVDALFDEIVRSWTLDARLYGNDLEQIIDTAPICRSKFQTTITEPLFGFAGTSEFRPHAILPAIIDLLPPVIQDYTMTLAQHERVKVSSSNFEVLDLVPSTIYSIQTRNVETFDQSTKDLQKCSIQFPLMLRFESDSLTVQYETQRGPPDKIMVYLEKQDAWSKYQPVIKTIQVKIIGQNIDSVSKLDTTHLYYATKRNSNFRCSTNWNREFRGAVLLDQVDLERWGQWSNLRNVDNFKGEITISSFDHYSDTYKPSQEVKTSLEGSTHRMTVVFFYQDYSLTGELNNLRFVKN